MYLKKDIPGLLSAPCCCDACGSIEILYTQSQDPPDGCWPWIWRCNECGASVGCHVGTNLPLGTMADLETRQLRAKAHSVFDKLWRSGLVSRVMAYKWLAAELKIYSGNCHLSQMSKDQLEQAIKVSERFYREREKYVERRAAKREQRKWARHKRIKKYIENRKKRH